MKKQSFSSRLKHAWNTFVQNDGSINDIPYVDYGRSYNYNPSKTLMTSNTETSIVMPLYNKIAIDVAAVDIRHARVDQNGSYVETLQSTLQTVLSTSANIDQTGRALIMDLVLSLIDEGCVAVVPVETSIDPTKSTAYEILSLRVGRILQWYPAHIEVELYNENEGRLDRVTVPKKTVAIIENPHYPVMNEPNSVLKRLIAKLNLLDVIDTQSGSGKLDLIIQLPYIIKSEARRQQAEQRRQDLEDQLKNSQLGIGYTDGTEKVIQLNRTIENKLMDQITFLTKMLYNQLGFTESVFDGTADEVTMINYYNRTVEPILKAITDEMKRKFLTKTAISQKQTIMYFRDPFKLTPVSQIAEIADKFTRNEILSSNEIRAIIGKEPSVDPKADVLRNKNLPEVAPETQAPIDHNIKQGGK